jgi:hypothetical protein
LKYSEMSCVFALYHLPLHRWMKEEARVTAASPILRSCEALEGAVAPRGRDSPITTGQNATGVNAPLLPAIQTIRKSLPDDT